METARELLAVQANMGGGYNRGGARLILAEIQPDHGQTRYSINLFNTN